MQPIRLMIGALSVASLANGTIVQVPNDYASIPEALKSTSFGDTIRVAPGTYGMWLPDGLRFDGVDRALEAEASASETVLDFQGGRGFVFSGESEACRIEGFTVTGGHTMLGGGIGCWSASPTILDCIVVANSSGHAGGGIYCTRGSSPRIERCEVRDNRAEIYGGGICVEFDSYPSIYDCIVSRNQSGLGGGAFFHDYHRKQISGCTFRQNQADYGGGVYFQRCGRPGRMDNCRILDNRAYYGAGVYFEDSGFSIHNCVLAHNEATNWGGGVYFRGSINTLDHCTLAENVAGMAGGAIYIADSSSPTLSNSIVWDHAPNPIHLHDAGERIRVNHSDVQGGYSGSGNMDENPRFRAYRDYSHALRAGSPCIDTGTGADDGLDWSRLHPRYGRMNGPEPDMGAYGGPRAVGWLDG